MHNILHILAQARKTTILSVLFLFMLNISLLSASDINYRNYKQTIKPRISAAAAFHQISQQRFLENKPFARDLSAQEPENKNFSVSAAPQIEGPVTEAINYAHDDSLNNWPGVPPDNAACVGPDHFLLAVNTAIEWYTKSDRMRQYSESLNTFFSATSPSDLFDPRVLYDQYNERYVVVADEENDDDEINFMHIAVSQTNDPNDGWYFQRIETKLNINGVDTWLDFPCLGVSSEALYLSGNMFSFSSVYQATRLWILDKGLYSGATSTVNLYDPSTEAGLSSQAFTLFPAHLYGTQPEGLGNFLFSSEWDDNQGNNDLIALFRVEDPLGNSSGPTFTVQMLNPGEIHNNSLGVPEAPQKDSSIDIDFGDERAQSCIWRDNTFVGAFTINPSTGSQSGQATNFWFTVNTSNLSALSLDQQGLIEGDDISPATSTGFPAVTMNSNGDIGIGFSASSSNTYAGAYFAVHQSGDTAGTNQGSQLLHEGVDTYVRTGLPMHIGNRWGDYSSIALDPSDGNNFWVYNQYAWTHGNYDPFADEDGRWATAFALINPNGFPSAIDGNAISAKKPRQFFLEQNYPNPFNPQTRIKYQVAKRGRVQLTVYNALGQKVQTLVNREQNVGHYSITFDAGALASGVYIYTLSTANGFSVSKKMIVMQ